MKLFDVYPVFDIEPVKGEGPYVWDSEGNKYLDFYGGHAVISIGHTHPHYVKKITEQLNKIGFYSNSVKMPLQEELAEKLGELSGCPEYNLFLVNSGAEANENALKLASFTNGKKKIVTFTKGFHGRTSLAVVVTDNPKIQAPVNQTMNVIMLPFNDEQALERHFYDEVSAVIVEGVQGIGGINLPSERFLRKIRELCDNHNAVMILDEVQSGYGRTGKFFGFQHTDVKPDIITVAKGMGNGFPIGGVLISDKFPAHHGMLGTTFGGNHLGCAAAIAVLDVIKEEGLLDNTKNIGDYLCAELEKVEGVKDVRGLGLMIGIDLEEEAKTVRNRLLKEFKIFTGSASKPETMRLLPALNIKKEHADQFLEAFNTVMKKQVAEK